MKYTKELLEQHAIESVSFSDLARRLGLSPVGSTITHLRRRCSSCDVDTSHFTGQAHQRCKPARNKLAAYDVLVVRQKEQGREDVRRLRRALIEMGVEERCSVCGLDPHWNGLPLRLQIDHIDGCFWNNTKENLRFVCPNCHTQTETWGSKNNA